MISVVNLEVKALNNKNNTHTHTHTVEYHSKHQPLSSESPSPHGLRIHRNSFDEFLTRMKMPDILLGFFASDIALETFWEALVFLPELELHLSFVHLFVTHYKARPAWYFTVSVQRFLIS